MSLRANGDVERSKHATGEMSVCVSRGHDRAGRGVAAGRVLASAGWLCVACERDAESAAARRETALGRVFVDEFYSYSIEQKNLSAF